MQQGDELMRLVQQNIQLTELTVQLSERIERLTGELHDRSAPTQAG